MSEHAKATTSALDTASYISRRKDVLDACGLSDCTNKPSVDAALPFLTLLSQSAHPNALKPCVDHFRLKGFAVLVQREPDPFDKGQPLEKAYHRRLLRKLRHKVQVPWNLIRLEEYEHIETGGFERYGTDTWTDESDLRLEV